MKTVSCLVYTIKYIRNTKGDNCNNVSGNSKFSFYPYSLAVIIYMLPRQVAYTFIYITYTYICIK